MSIIEYFIENNPDASADKVIRDWIIVISMVISSMRKQPILVYSQKMVPRS